MTTAEIQADSIKQAGTLLKTTLADFSDADLLSRPCPGANHAAWQVGHLINAQVSFLTGMGAAAPELPAGFSEKFSKLAAKSDDPATFVKKDELLALFERVNNASAEFAGACKPEDLDKPSPQRIRQLVATRGLLFQLMATHTAMHVGQMQVIRRKLGKPVLF